SWSRPATRRARPPRSSGSSRTRPPWPRPARTPAPTPARTTWRSAPSASRSSTPARWPRRGQRQRALAALRRGGGARPGAAAARRGRQDVIVAVTGASGGLGRALVRHLIARGHRVRAAVRTPEQAELASALGAEPIEADLRRPETLARLVAGAEVVHHLAAWMGAPAGQAHAVNVEGTRAVAAAAAAAGARRLVHASSMAVYGPV